MSPDPFDCAWWIGGLAVSVVLSIGGMWAARWFIVTLPADYFVDGTQPVELAGRHPLIRWAWLLAKNALGVFLIVAGVAMLVAPGPGVLAILIGLCLVSLPGKRALTRRLLGGRHVLAQLNALRARAGKPPLAAPVAPAQGDGESSDRK